MTIEGIEAPVPNWFQKTDALLLVKNLPKSFESPQKYKKLVRTKNAIDRCGGVYNLGQQLNEEQQTKFLKKLTTAVAVDLIDHNQDFIGGRLLEELVCTPSFSETWIEVTEAEPMTMILAIQAFKERAVITGKNSEEKAKLMAGSLLQEAANLLDRLPTDDEEASEKRQRIADNLLNFAGENLEEALELSEGANLDIWRNFYVDYVDKYNVEKKALLPVISRGLRASGGAEAAGELIEIIALDETVEPETGLFNKMAEDFEELKLGGKKAEDEQQKLSLLKSAIKRLIKSPDSLEPREKTVRLLGCLPKTEEAVVVLQTVIIQEQALRPDEPGRQEILKAGLETAAKIWMSREPETIQRASEILYSFLENKHSDEVLTRLCGELIRRCVNNH